MREGGSNSSINVRPIENGYLTERSSCGPNGDYNSSTSFSKTKPMIKEARVSGYEGSTDTTGFNKSSMGREINEQINGKIR